jgi:hypothetical protein
MTLSKASSRVAVLFKDREYLRELSLGMICSNQDKLNQPYVVVAKASPGILTR